ncbi:MAG: hypothetical protein IT379_15075 [Deltaproteobacteria bacterium]|nr:hypothetical protein [Deltaproteobacteria bacterium]
MTLETVERASGAAVGIRQAGAGTMAFATLIAAAVSPVEWPFVMRDGSAMRALAEGIDEPRLRAYFRSGDYDRESRTTVWGLIARLEMILSIAPIRAMLVGSGGFSFGRAFEPGMVTLVALDGAPAGAQSVAEALGALITTRLAWAAFDTGNRPRADTIVLGFDELASIGVPSVVEAVERVLTTGRSFGLSLISAAQFANQIAALDHLFAANVHRRVFGRSSVREIEHAASEWLPVTGTEPKQRRPGDAPRPIEFMSEAEEIRSWTRRISRLPVRSFLVGDRTAPFRSRLVEAPAVDPPAWDVLPARVRDLVARGGFGVLRAELLRHLHVVETAAADRVGATTTGPRETRGNFEMPDLARRRATRPRRRDVP